MFKPKDSSMSPRFVGPRTFMRLPFENTLENVDFLIMGVPFDTAASNRTGQRYGPQSIRDFSVLLRPYNPDQGINIFDYCSGIDYGDVDVIPGNVLKTYDHITEKLDPILDQGIIPVMLGGDHSISLGHLRSFAKKYGPVSLVHFDSHSDTWEDYFGEKYVHGTPFRRAAEEGLVDTKKSIQVGMRGPLYGPEDMQNARDLGYKVIEMREARKLGIEKVIEQIHQRVGNSPVFVSFDIDFLDPAYAPGTGTPEVGGPTSFEALEYVRKLDGLNIKGFDLVEVLPTYDSGEITAVAASSVVYEMITLIALAKRRNSN
ncbi:MULTISPECIES: agmatinase [Staphylococcus]|jgi:agmatinase|uniref:Agmatinase n=1 Tax=Staphylococcus nepalensis TaxID=214473 RepID=A0A291JP39_9STAP|nr:MULTISPECIES: agmatinase [Staphylococcus]VDG68323.1 agmatinase [Lacrimispora indolis]ATH61273.1 agmatinase [Staphylococcus nepalensis]ATH66303.1 agmatinase [Staphylococcus nepalensis]MBO1206079.1 agmatinase [Staphylococcus nepalensis]MBO1216786.1 agmatinase [Staphylococcus nepalensis]